MCNTSLSKSQQRSTAICIWNCEEYALILYAWIHEQALVLTSIIERKYFGYNGGYFKYISKVILFASNITCFKLIFIVVQSKVRWGCARWRWRCKSIIIEVVYYSFFYVFTFEFKDPVGWFVFTIRRDNKKKRYNSRR